MATMKEKEQEKKIPVLAVEKNGGIVKNIFLNSPVLQLESEQEPSKNSEKSNKKEEKLLVGRHPDCHLVLDHPSISRFHVEIKFETLSQKLSATDLSSVHGTWVSGKKIEPQIPIELQEGNTLRFGASIRIYRLQWVPLKWAFEIESPEMSIMQEDQEVHQDENSISSLRPEHTSPVPGREENQNPDHQECSSIWSRRGKSLDSIRIQTGRAEENIPINIHVDTKAINCKETTNMEQGKTQNGSQEPFSELLCRGLYMEADGFSSNKENLQPSLNLRVEEASRLGLQRPFSEVLHMNQQMVTDGFCSDTENFMLLGRNLKRSLDNGKSIAEPSSPDLQGSSSKVLLSNLGMVEDMFPSDKENSTPTVPLNMKIAEKPEIQKSCSKVLFSNSEMVEEGFSSDKESLKPKMTLARKSNKKSVCEKLKMETPGVFQSSCSDVLFPPSEMVDDGLSSDKESAFGYLNMEAKIFSATSKTKKQELLKQDYQRSCSKVLFSSSETVEGGFSSDKENFTPKIRKAVLGNWKMECKIKQLELQDVSTPNMEMEDCVLSLDTENQTPQISKVLKSKKMNCHRVPERTPFKVLVTNSPCNSKTVPNATSRINNSISERVPFQVLLKNSPCNIKAVPNATSRNSNSINHIDTTSRKRTPFTEQSVDQAFPKVEEAKKQWNIIVDTSCFLNEESRRSLKLLEGLRGTHLIIPRMVIRELDCLKWRESRFKKPNVASLILQWIEECMVKTKWWIHVQSSAESTLIAETPPVSPRSRLSEGSNDNSIPFSTCGSFLEIVSPTAEDHILECALLFKKIKTDGQLILITNDIALKIKAMAEGLICETPKGFRESLVNPFSERFLWTESTPRGPTWSSLGSKCSANCGVCEGDPMRRKAAADGAKGLKLILLHNYHYGQHISSVK